ncbi:MAG TPA: ribbon-helix-helix domain-containing protein [Candidatus Saccharimonadales bacterium]|jgi:metal-responsive CopG/Arc/MetJ family transcriptional regulator
MPTQIVNISLPGDLVKKIDTAAKANYATRSEFIRQSVVSRLSAEDKDIWAALENASNEIAIEAERLGYVTDKDIAQVVKSVRKAK